MADLAPIVIFIYRRPAHLRKTLDSLARCVGFEHSKIIVFGDGPKTPADRDAVAATRRMAETLLGSHAEYHFRDSNAGLANSIIGGVSLVTRRFGSAIVLEDDLELSPSFIDYMNAALNRYALEERVFQVSGQLFATPQFAARDTALFLPFTTSWGWGTWHRAWQRFDPAAHGWQQLQRDRALRKRFNLDGGYDFSTMLERQMAGLGDSWAIRWYWSVFRNDGMVCFPPVSLVRNTGMDGSGTHGRGLLRRFKTEERPPPTLRIELPDQISVQQQDFNFVKQAMWQHNGGHMGSIIDSLRRRLFLLTGKHM